MFLDVDNDSSLDLISYDEGKDYGYGGKRQKLRNFPPMVSGRKWFGHW